MLTKEQIEDRQTGCGGSDLAALLGLDKYRQAVDVFYSKRPDLAAEAGYVAPIVEGPHVEFGNLAEEPLAQIYAQKHGCRVQRSNQLHRHPKAPYLIANIDRRVVGVRRGLEIKTSIGHWTLARDWGPSGTDEVAEYYLPQPMHYMLVLDYPEWDVAALVGGTTDIRYYRMLRDPEWDEIIMDTAADFWKLVEKGEAPSVDPDHRAAAQVVKRVYAKVEGEEVLLPEEASHWHQVAAESAALAKRYSDTADNAKAHLATLMGNAGLGRILGVDGAYTRKVVKRAGFTVKPTQYVDFRFSKRN